MSNSSAEDKIRESINAAKSPYQAGFTAFELQLKEFPPVKYIVEGYIAAGVTILVGKPKLGKSWAVLDFAVSVATGCKAFGSVACEQGDVLYLALEDNPRRLQKRLSTIIPDSSNWPKNLRIETDWPKLSEGGVDKIKEWIKSVSNPRLIIIDTLGKIRGAQNTRDNQFQADYNTISELQNLIGNYDNLANIIVHHDRKAEAEDPFDTVSGTLGISGAADSIVIFKRISSGVVLYGRGRDIEEFEVAVQFDKKACKWRILGNAAQVNKSDERKEIIEILEAEKAPATPRDVADLLSKSAVTIRQAMMRMAKAGEIKKIKHGLYAINDYVEEGCHISHNVTSELETKQEGHPQNEANVTGVNDAVTMQTKKSEKKPKKTKVKKSK